MLVFFPYTQAFDCLITQDNEEWKGNWLDHSGSESLHKHIQTFISPQLSAGFHKWSMLYLKKELYSLSNVHIVLCFFFLTLKIINGFHFFLQFKCYIGCKMRLYKFNRQQPVHLITYYIASECYAYKNSLYTSAKTELWLFNPCGTLKIGLDKWTYVY